MPVVISQTPQAHVREIVARESELSVLSVNTATSVGQNSMINSGTRGIQEPASLNRLPDIVTSQSGLGGNAEAVHEGEDRVVPELQVAITHSRIAELDSYAGRVNSSRQFQNLIWKIMASFSLLFGTSTGFAAAVAMDAHNKPHVVAFGIGVGAAATSLSLGPFTVYHLLRQMNNR